LSVQTALLHLVHAETLRGNAERLIALEQQLGGVTTSDSSRLTYIVRSRAMRAAWAGEFEEAFRLLSTHRSFYDFEGVLNSALHALFAISSGRRDTALEMIGHAQSELDTLEFKHVYAQRMAETARLLCAVVEALAGRLTNAGRILQRRPLAEGPTIECMREVALCLCKGIKNPVLRSDVDDAIGQLQLTAYGGFALLLQSAAAKHFQDHDIIDVTLTPAEADVLRLLAEGRSPKDIALESGRSVYTVQVHVRNIIKKLGCSGRNEALTVARKRGLLA
jgi:DNA-binding CsgD family transcriptional regulator